MVRFQLPQLIVVDRSAINTLVRGVNHDLRKSSGWMRNLSRKQVATTSLVSSSLTASAEEAVSDRLSAISQNPKADG